MNNHLIIDCETLGQNVFTLPVLDFSYLIFDWDRFKTDPYTFDELLQLADRRKLKVKEQLDLGYVIDPNTVKWWKSQGEAAQSVLLPSRDDIDIKTFLDDMLSYIGDTKIKYWWSRSNTFDPIILQRLATSAGQDYVARISNALKFWLVRDTRTYIDSMTGFNPKMISFCPMKNESAWTEKFIPHSSKHDIVADVLRLQTLTRVNADLEIIE